MLQKNKNSEIVVFNCKIDPVLREKFKIKTIKNKTTMADVVIDAIKEYVNNK